MAKTEFKKVTIPLDLIGNKRHEIVVLDVGGPRGCLWFGEKDGRCLGILDGAGLSKLHTALGSILTAKQTRTTKKRAA
jgi:hypothetical protein